MPEPEFLEPLLDALKSDRSIVRHGANVEVELNGDVVTLKGEARHIAAKRRAAALAMKFARGRRIVDALRRDVSRRLGDRELATTVAERLAQEPVFAEYGLESDSDGGRQLLHDAGEGAYALCVSALDDDTIRLTGTVGTLTHRRLAEVIAWWTGACALVLNELEIVPPEEDSDDELTDAIRMTLEKDPLVDAGQLRVGTAGGVVHVEGLALSPEQHESVLEDVWLVPGVADVVDRVASQGAGVPPGERAELDSVSRSHSSRRRDVR
ncbi:MAG: BON domain-containing protein [Gammaproteobacteria bacterium]|nr:BON domain-containing protein [Gammaproteobacteria bacterium]